MNGDHWNVIIYYTFVADNDDCVYVSPTTLTDNECSVGFGKFIKFCYLNLFY